MQYRASENLKLILFLNKIDRLIEIMNFNSERLYFHLRDIIDNINASMNVFLESKIKLNIEKNPTLKEKYFFIN